MKLPSGLGLLANPVLARESRVRMRGWKAPGLVTLYVGILGLVVALIILIAGQERRVFAPELGSIVNIALVAVQYGLLIFSAPGLTAGAIAGERERQTLDLLLVTHMTPLQVVLGKLGAALAFTMLLMLASLPVYSILFLLGGISLYRMLLTVIIYVVTVLLLGAIGLYFSALFKRTQAAVVAAYGTSFGLIILSMVFSVLVFEVFNRPPDTPPALGLIFAYMNPAMGLMAAVGEPVSEMTRLYGRVLETGAAREAIWWKYALSALGSTAVLIWLTVRRIRPLKG